MSYLDEYKKIKTEVVRTGVSFFSISTTESCDNLEYDVKATIDINHSHKTIPTDQYQSWNIFLTCKNTDNSAILDEEIKNIWIQTFKEIYLMGRSSPITIHFYPKKNKLFSDQESQLSINWGIRSHTEMENDQKINRIIRKLLHDLVKLNHQLSKIKIQNH